MYPGAAPDPAIVSGLQCFLHVSVAPGCRGRAGELCRSAAEGVGVAQAQDTARLVVTVRPAAGPDTFPEVELAGTRAGLEWLAEQILRVARAEQELHTHLDADAHRPVYVSPGGWWLTIERSERLRRARQAEPLSWPTDLRKNENPGSG